MLFMFKWTSFTLVPLLEEYWFYTQSALQLVFDRWHLPQKWKIIHDGWKNVLLRWWSVDSRERLCWKSGRRNTKCEGDYSPPLTVQCQLVILGCIIRISSLHLPSFKCTDYHAKAPWGVRERGGTRGSKWLQRRRRNGKRLLSHCS